MLRRPPRPGRLVMHTLRGLLVGVVVAFALHFAFVLGGPNFRAIAPGRAYRSGQLSPERLESYVRRHGIRTVVNLRGCCVAADWYRAQADATARLDVAQEDLSFSATRMPSTTSVRQLVEVLDRSERPLLIHCQQGADRTGLASVVVLLLDGVPLDVALRQLGPASGHVPLGRTVHVDRFFDQYRAWLAGRAHSTASFREWAAEHYCPDGARAAFEVVPAGPIRVRPGVFHRVTVRCHNRSDDPWHFEPGPTAGVHGLWRVEGRDGRTLALGRTGLRRARVGPGETIDLDVALPPLPPGEYALCFDLTQEQHAAFVQLGNDPLSVPVDVGAP